MFEYIALLFLLFEKNNKKEEIKYDKNNHKYAFGVLMTISTPCLIWMGICILKKNETGGNIEFLSFIYFILTFGIGICVFSMLTKKNKNG